MPEQIKPLSSRDFSFDALRAIGLLLIILAHAGSPGIIFQLRNFDVPLMMFVSGAVFGISSGISKPYLIYFFDRLKRLLLPTWVFLAIFFGLYALASVIARQPYPFSSQTIINSFNLSSGIGYVWIVRVFLLVAIAMPFYVKLSGKLKNNYLYLLILALIYAFYELLYYFYPVRLVSINFPAIDFFFQNVVFYILPYSVVAGLGLGIAKMNKKNLAILIAGFSTLLIILAFANHFAFTQTAKYPPRLYYLSYALLVSLSLYTVRKTNIFNKLFANKYFLFLGSSSLWIYLWQILYLFVWKIVPKTTLSNNYLGAFIFVLLLSVITTYVQRYLVKKFLQITQLSGIARSLLVDAFLK